MSWVCVCIRNDTEDNLDVEVAFGPSKEVCECQFYDDIARGKAKAFRLDQPYECYSWLVNVQGVELDEVVFVGEMLMESMKKYYAYQDN